MGCGPSSGGCHREGGLGRPAPSRAPAPPVTWPRRTAHRRLRHPGGRGRGGGATSRGRWGAWRSKAVASSAVLSVGRFCCIKRLRRARLLPQVVRGVHERTMWHEAAGRSDASGGIAEVFDRLVERGVFVGHCLTVY